MKDLVIERESVEIEGKLDDDDECYFRMYNSFAYLNREEIQQVIDHLTKLLKV